LAIGDVWQRRQLKFPKNDSTRLLVKKRLADKRRENQGKAISFPRSLPVLNAAEKASVNAGIQILRLDGTVSRNIRNGIQRNFATSRRDGTTDDHQNVAALIVNNKRGSI
jgi:hypothetical protein